MYFSLASMLVSMLALSNVIHCLPFSIPVLPCFSSVFVTLFTYFVYHLAFCNCGAALFSFMEVNKGV